MTHPDSASRFSNRVDDYVRYRPGYPPALWQWLHTQHGEPAGSVVADIGAGTGISSQALLQAGHTVIAVEPNAAMRHAAAQWLTPDWPRFAAVDGNAEATGLPDASVGLISAAQAFHWFDTDAIVPEWKRVLTPGGRVLVYWNSRLLDGSGFLRGYEQLLLDYGTDYSAVAERYQSDAQMAAWFGTGLQASAQFANVQLLDFDALRGRLLSSSYAPVAGQPGHAPMLAALRALFDAQAVDGRVAFEYQTRAFLGTLD